FLSLNRTFAEPDLWGREGVRRASSPLTGVSRHCGVEAPFSTAPERSLWAGSKMAVATTMSPRCRRRVTSCCDDECFSGVMAFEETAYNGCIASIADNLDTTEREESIDLTAGVEWPIKLRKERGAVEERMLGLLR